jgi:hypothetical protein
MKADKTLSVLEEAGDERFFPAKVGIFLQGFNPCGVGNLKRKGAIWFGIRGRTGRVSGVNTKGVNSGKAKPSSARKLRETLVPPSDRHASHKH